MCTYEALMSALWVHLIKLMCLRPNMVSSENAKQTPGGPPTWVAIVSSLIAQGIFPASYISIKESTSRNIGWATLLSPLSLLTLLIWSIVAATEM